MRSALLVALAAAVALVSFPAAAQVTKTLRVRSKPPVTTNVVKQTPLIFYVAKGERDACGRDCSEWIAVEGTFDRGSADRFRAFLKRLGKQNLPVIFNSPGGEVSNAFAVGRAMRARGMAASLGQTMPDGCNATDAEACRRIKASGKPVPARLVTLRGQCSSACVWAFVGAKEREVPPGALLGVHSHRQDITITVRAGYGVSDARMREYADRRFDEFSKSAQVSGDRKARAYLKEMGISPDLYTLATTIPHERVNYLKRNEIARFGIDTRSAAESIWSLVEPVAATQRPYLIKVMAEDAGDGKGFHSSLLVISCSTSSSQVTLLHGEELGWNNNAIPVGFEAGDRKVLLPKNGHISKLGPAGHQTSYTTRGVRVSLDFFEAAAQSGGIELVEVVFEPRKRKFSAEELARPLQDLRRSCERTPQPSPQQSPSQ